MQFRPGRVELRQGRRQFASPVFEPLLCGQARTAFARFFGELPPREHDAELRRLLTQ